MNAFFLRLSPAHRGMTMVLCMVVLFTLMDVISKYLSRFYPVSLILWARFSFHCLLFAVFLGPRIGVSLVRTRRLRWQLLRGFTLSGAAYCFTASLKYLPLAEATSIAYLNPIFIALLAVFFLGEEMPFGNWLASFIAFAGVLIVIRPGSGLFSWAALLPLANAVLFACYQVLTRRLANIENQYCLIFYPGLLGACVYTLLVLPEWVMPSAPHFGMLVLVGLISGTSHLVMIRALKLATASYLAPFSYTQLIWVLLAGHVFFGDFPDIWSLFGIALLIGSSLYCARRPGSSGRRVAVAAE